MTVDAIKAAIEQLPEQERRELADWLDEMENRAWDAEMERDFAPGGRGQHLADDINQQIEKQNYTLLDEGLGSRQKRQ